MFFRTFFSRFAVLASAAVCTASAAAFAQNGAPAKLSEFTNHATVWPDNNGAHISAHGGCMLKVGDTYYWYGEHRARDRRTGVHVYSSKDLYNWKDEGLVFDSATMQTQGQQGQGGRRSAAHSGGDGDVFLQMDDQRGDVHPGGLAVGEDRLAAEILLGFKRDARRVAEDGHAEARGRIFEADHVGRVAEGIEERIQVVIAVGAFRGDGEREIDFGAGQH